MDGLCFRLKLFGRDLHHAPGARVVLLGFEAGLLEFECLSVFADGADLSLVEPVLGDGSDLKADFQLDPVDGGEVLDHLAGDAAEVARVGVRIQGGRAEKPGV